MADGAEDTGIVVVKRAANEYCQVSRLKQNSKATLSMNLLQSLDHDKLSVIALYKLTLERASALGVSVEGSFAAICEYAGVNRTQLYERVDQVKAHLEKIELFGPGRPICQPLPASNDQDAKGWQFREAALRHRIKHFGSLTEHIGGHTTYSDSFVRLILDLSDTWEGSQEWFCEQVEVPYQTFRSWLKKDQVRPYEEHKARHSAPYDGPASNDVLQVVQDYKLWEGSVKDFAKFESVHLHLRQTAIYRILKIFGMLPMRSKKDPRYRGSTTKCFPGIILVTDGKTVQLLSTDTGELHDVNWQGMVDQSTGCHTAVVVTANECAQGIIDAYDKSCEFLGAPPMALLHDNKPIHDDKGLRAHIEKATIMIPATPARGQNKAIIEGEFGKFEQSVGTIRIDETNETTRRMSTVHEVLRAYTAGLNHARRAELGGKSRQGALRETCPDPETQRKYIANLHGDHTKKWKPEPLSTKEVSRVVLDEAFERFGLINQDPEGKRRDWLASSFTPDSIREGVAIFGAKYEKGKLRSKHSIRYLVKVIINRQHEHDLRRQEELLREFAEMEKRAWLKIHEAKHAQLLIDCEGAPEHEDLAIRLAENTARGSLNIQRAFWENKLKEHIMKQRDRYVAVCSHIRRLFEIPEKQRFTLISKLVAWESGLTV